MALSLTQTLAEIFRRERLSFLQYVGQVSAYAGPGERATLRRIEELARAQAENLDRFAEYLEEKHLPPPPPGAFPSHFTNFNFVAMKKLVRPLVDDQAKGLQQLESDVSRLPAGKDREWVERMLESKRMHLNELEKMAQ